MKWYIACSGRQPADRRQHAERVAGQEDDVLRVPAHAGNLGVRDELDRVAAARVLGDRRVVVVDDARDRVVDHVLQHRAEADRVEDLRLCSARQVDALGVAAAFDVEDRRRSSSARRRRSAAPRDRPTASSCRCPTGRRTATTSPSAPSLAEQCIDSTPALRHQVVHDREHALLHLAGVLGAEDDELAALERQGDAGALVIPGVRGWPGTGRRCRSRSRARRTSPAARGRPDQHVVHEQRVVGPRADDADLDAVLGIPAGEAVDHVEPVARVEEVSVSRVRPSSGPTPALRRRASRRAAGSCQDTGASAWRISIYRRRPIPILAGIHSTPARRGANTLGPDPGWMPRARLRSARWDAALQYRAGTARIER
jgi:hypothetical protein